MKQILFLAFLLLSLPSVGQITFEKGYLIDNQGNRKEILIHNRDWKSNPTDFTWKNSQSAPTEVSGLNEVREFGIEGRFRYVRFVAPIDRAPQDLEHLDSHPKQDFEDEMVYLRQLLDGKADLFIFEEGRTRQFYYRLPDQEIQALRFKKYRQGNSILSNTRFRKQLFQDLNCGRLPAEHYRDIDYSQKDLVEYFSNYNTCVDSDPVLIERIRDKAKFHLLLKGGVHQSSFDVEEGLSLTGESIGFDPTVSFGIEGEMVLPFHQKKWALSLEAFYRSLKKTGASHQDRGLPTNEAALVLLEHEFLSGALGAKYSFYLPGPLRLFVGAGPAFDIPLHSKIVFDRGSRYELKPEINSLSQSFYFKLRMGMVFWERLSAEIQYDTPRRTNGRHTVPGHYIFDWLADMDNISLHLGYRIF